MPSLLDVAADWVTLRAETDDGKPILVLLDRAIATTAPYEEFTQQVAVAVPLSETADGQPSKDDQPRLRELEQQLVDAAVGEARLVAVMTLEGLREWMLYARSTAWALPFVEAGVSVQAGEDPGFVGLLELAGA
ncbi:MAG: hypothetical protein JWN31_943 [Frankiales bacterium]|nr:hypothetical protein [Frankiales bacterium]